MDVQFTFCLEGSLRNMLQEHVTNSLLKDDLLSYCIHFNFIFLVPYGTPRNFSGYNISAYQIQLFWQDVEKELKNGMIKGYTIFYQIEGSTTEQEKDVPVSNVDPNSPPMTVTVDGLSAYSLYNISIAAYTEYPGDGKRSQAIFIKTDSNSKFILI